MRMLCGFPLHRLLDAKNLVYVVNGLFCVPLFIMIGGCPICDSKRLLQLLGVKFHIKYLLFCHWVDPFNESVFARSGLPLDRALFSPNMQALILTILYRANFCRVLRWIHVSCRGIVFMGSSDRDSNMA